MTETDRPVSPTRVVLAIAGAIALVMSLVPLAPSAHGQDPGGEATTAQADSPIEFERQSGATRYQTAAEIATAAYPASTDVVIATGEGFADALAGAALEGALDAPVLLVPSGLINGAIPTAITDAIDDLGATSATLLGGTSAISDGVADYIVDNTTVQTTDRVAGSTRFETAEEIAERVAGPTAGVIPDAVQDEFGLTGDTGAFLATGLDWPDSMAGSAGAFEAQQPILLTGPDELHAAADRGLEAAGADVVFILGGEAVVSSAVEGELQTQGYETVRLSGADRWETATEVADAFADDWGYGVADVGLATGFAFADALASAPYLGGTPAPLVLTPTSDTHATTAAWFDTRGCDIETIHVFGGELAVEQAVADAYAETACPDDGEPDEGEADTLELTPQTATNPVDSDHTVTAELSRTDGSDVTDESVRFATYPAGGGAAIDASVEDVTDGEATFTYSSDTERDDVIVACTGSTSCVDGSDLTIDPATDEPDNLDPERVVDFAEKSWEDPVPTALELDPETATNSHEQDHTVTGTVVDQFGDPVDVTEDVRFEVFRTTDDGDTWSLEESGDRTTGADPSDDPEVADPEDPGQASFVYTGPSADADDVIVACVLDGGETECAEVAVDELGDEAVDVTTESDLVDTGEKAWVAPEYSVALSQTESFNEAGTDHTYTGQVTDQFGDTAPAGIDVHSQVYRRFVGDDGDAEGDLTREEELVETTDADGAVEFTYTGPAGGQFDAGTRDGDGDFDGSQDADTADDTIVGCVGVTAHDDCSQVGGTGEVDVNPAVESDQLDKMWAPVESGVEDGAYTGQALRQDRGANTFVLRTDDDRFIEFATDQDGDEFTVDGDATADRDRFEMELQLQIANDADHTVAVTLNNDAPFTPNTWNLTTADLDGEAIDADFQDISGSGSTLATVSTSDEACEQVQMPFGVDFYDVTTVFLHVDTSGYIRVGQTPDGTCGNLTDSAWVNQNLPATHLGRGIAAFWDDLNPSEAGTVYTETVGSAPDRTFIVQYDDVEHWAESGTVRFQVQIHEATNDVEVHYDDVDPGDANWQFGASATIGIQQSEDGPSTTYLFNQEAIFDGEALRFNTN